jgi:hypothetical protein
MRLKIGRWYFSFLVVVFCHGQLPVSGQGEFNNWFFGNKAGVSFATVPPINLAGSQMTTVTSTVSVSDSNGVLQFYSNGWRFPLLTFYISHLSFHIYRFTFPNSNLKSENLKSGNLNEKFEMLNEKWKCKPSATSILPT